VSVNFRKLAAIDVAFLDPKFIITEFAVGVLFSIALGIFALLRAHSLWGTAVGAYLVSLGINYGPMLAFALAIGSRENARLELGDQLKEKRVAMSKYRRQSLLFAYSSGCASVRDTPTKASRQRRPCWATIISQRPGSLTLWNFR